jgi:hypothetical protein
LITRSRGNTGGVVLVHTIHGQRPAAPLQGAEGVLPVECVGERSGVVIRTKPRSSVQIFRPQAGDLITSCTDGPKTPRFGQEISRISAYQHGPLATALAPGEMGKPGGLVWGLAAGLGCTIPLAPLRALLGAFWPRSRGEQRC